MAVLVREGQRQAEEVQGNFDYMLLNKIVQPVAIPQKTGHLPVTGTVATLMRRCRVDAGCRDRKPRISKVLLVDAQE